MTTLIDDLILILMLLGRAMFVFVDPDPFPLLHIMRRKALLSLLSTSGRVVIGRAIEV